MHSSETSKIFTVPFFPIGGEFAGTEASKFQNLLNDLSDKIDFTAFPHCITETDVLRVTDAILDKEREGRYDFDCLILPVIQGGSARKLVLAGSRCGLPVILWSHNLNHSLASASLAKESLKQLEIPSLLLHDGLPDTSEKARDFIKAASAMIHLRKYRIGIIGSLHENLIGSEVNPLSIYKRFGTWITKIPLPEFLETFQSIRKEELKPIQQNLGERFSVKMNSEFLERNSRVHAALIKLKDIYDIHAFAVDCWNLFLPSTGVGPCVGFAFDNYDIGCEGDILSTILLKAGYVISGRKGYSGDFYSFSGHSALMRSKHCSGHHSLHFGNSKTILIEAHPPGPISDKGSILSCRPELPHVECTIALLHGENGNSIYIGEGKIEETDFADQMNVVIKINGSGEQLIRNSAGNHYSIFLGKNRKSMETWANFMGLIID